MTTKVDHLAFRVSDLDKITDLMKQLGYVEVRRTTHHGGAVEMESPAQPGLILEFTLLLTHKGEVPGFDHACFSLEGMEQYEELVAGGFPSNNPPHLSPGSERLITNFKDSDGTKWQFVINE